MSSSFDSRISDITMETITHPCYVTNAFLKNKEKAYFFNLKSEKARKVHSIYILSYICIILCLVLLVQLHRRIQERNEVLHVFETSFNLGEICMTFRTMAKSVSCHENHYISSLEWAE